MTETQELTLSDIKKIAEIGPKAPDTAVQHLRRAPEAEASEGSVKEALPPSEIQNMPGDLEVGDESNCKVIEHLDELDARDTAKAEVSVATTLVAPAAEKTKLVAITDTSFRPLRTRISCRSACQKCPVYMADYPICGLRGGLLFLRSVVA